MKNKLILNRYVRPYMKVLGMEEKDIPSLKFGGVKEINQSLVTSVPEDWEASGSMVSKSDHISRVAILEGNDIVKAVPSLETYSTYAYTPRTSTPGKSILEVAEDENKVGKVIWIVEWRKGHSRVEGRESDEWNILTWYQGHSIDIEKALYKEALELLLDKKMGFGEVKDLL